MTTSAHIMTEFARDEESPDAGATESTAELVGAVQHNFVGSWKLMSEWIPGGEWRAFGDVTAVTSGVGGSFFNRIFTPEMPVAADLTEAIDWMTAMGVPYWITIPDGGSETIDALDDRYRPAAAPQPGMAADIETVLDSSAQNGTNEVNGGKSEGTGRTDGPTEAGPGVDIQAVQTEADRTALVSVFADVFGMTTEAVADLLSDEAVSAPATRLFVGRVGGEPVACGQLVITDTVAGVYSIGVSDPYRRRGIGEAMTRSVLRAGREAGCTIAALQSSEMAVPLYESMGFRTVVTYNHFERVER